MPKEAIAMVFKDTKEPFVAQAIKIPALAQGEVLVRTTYATICTSDLHTFYGRRSGPTPSILGHEIIGKVVHLAEGGVNDYYGDPLRIGDRITWAVYAHDSSCRMSKKGIPQKSENLYKYGHEALSNESTLNGGFSTHCLLKSGSTIFKIPDSLSSPEAAPLNCTHATVAGALRLAGGLSGKRVLISGVGMLGLSACAMAREEGAYQVIASDLKERKLQHALLFGADQYFFANVSTADLKKDVAGEDGVDVVIETSGAPTAIEKCLNSLGIGGTIVLVGSVFPQRNISLNAETIVRKLLSIRGLHNYIPEDLAHAIRFLAKTHQHYPFQNLVGKEFPLNQLDMAFKTGNQGTYYRIGVQTNK